MRPAALRRWYAVHRWTSLICTLNLLLLCVTGLLLIFHHEIDELLGQEHHPAVVADATPPTLQSLIDKTLAKQPGMEIKSLSFFEHDEENFVGVRTGAPGVASLSQGKNLFFDAAGQERELINSGSFTDILLKLHVNLFLGFPGQLFIGVVGLIFVISMVSGIVLYGPFMRKLAFGLVRFGRQTRIVNTDLHNLSAIVVMVWALVVGLTGTFLSFSPLIIGVWQKTELSELVRTLPSTPAQTPIAADRAVAVAREADPGRDLAFVFYPGTEYATARHYMVVQRGHTELQKRIYSIVAVDAGNGEVAAKRGTPWYMQVLLLSGPFHFGDYAGMPLKILWALFTLLTTTATVTGFIIWMKRSKTAIRQLDAQQQDAAVGVKG